MLEDSRRSKEHLPSLHVAILGAARTLLYTLLTLKFNYIAVTVSGTLFSST